MRAGWLFALLSCLVAPGVRAEISPAMAPSVVLERLPPGIRVSSDPSGLRWSSAEADPQLGKHLVELVSIPAAEASEEWVEVDFTVDPDLDRLVRGVLERESVRLGHVILMDASSGEVFSYVSTDPELLPATRTYPTASLMKVVTAAAVLRSIPDAAEQPCRYEGSPYELAATHLEPLAEGGVVDTFSDAIRISNNQCFARLAVNELGREALLAEMVHVGLFEAPGVRHPAGRVDPIEDELALGQLGSGLSGSFVSLLGAARLAALLAEGQLVQPYWIAAARDARGRELSLPERRAPRPVWPPQVADELRRLMTEVTESGTAAAAFHDAEGRPRLGDIRVSGKTGTLSGQEPDGLYQWFIGIAPAEAPRIVVASLVLNEAFGPPRSVGAADVAAATLEALFCRDGLCDPGVAARLHARVAAREAAQERARTERELVALADLDQVPRPIGVPAFELPAKLRARKVDGEVVLLLELDPQGSVVDVKVDSSTAPGFEDFVVRQVRGWRFTPPTQGGVPVAAQARLPIPIHIN